MFPEVLSRLQQDLKFWHEKLYNLHTKSMFRLEKTSKTSSPPIKISGLELWCASLWIMHVCKSKEKAMYNKSE